MNKKPNKAHHHCVYNIKYHLVLVSKYRQPCFTQEMLDRLHIILDDLCIKWNVGLEEFNGENDHVHLLLDMNPNIAPSKFINNLKTVSSRLLRKDFSENLSQYYWSHPGIWTRAYCLISVGGAPLEVLKEYIRNQERPKE